MAELYKIQDAKGFVKNSSNKAVLNIDESALDAYKRRKKNLNEVQNAIDDINRVKAELQEIKFLLTQFLQSREQ